MSNTLEKNRECSMIKFKSKEDALAVYEKFLKRYWDVKLDSIDDTIVDFSYRNSEVRYWLNNYLKKNFEVDHICYQGYTSRPDTLSEIAVEIKCNDMRETNCLLRKLRKKCYYARIRHSIVEVIFTVDDQSKTKKYVKQMKSSIYKFKCKMESKIYTVSIRSPQIETPTIPLSELYKMPELHEPEDSISNNPLFRSNNMNTNTQKIYEACSMGYILASFWDKSYDPAEFRMFKAVISSNIENLKDRRFDSLPGGSYFIKEGEIGFTPYIIGTTSTGRPIDLATNLLDGTRKRFKPNEKVKSLQSENLPHMMMILLYLFMEDSLMMSFEYSTRPPFDYNSFKWLNYGAYNCLPEENTDEKESED